MRAGAASAKPSPPRRPRVRKPLLKKPLEHTFLEEEREGEREEKSGVLGAEKADACPATAATIAAVRSSGTSIDLGNAFPRALYAPPPATPHPDRSQRGQGRGSSL
eukprot:739877-Hanusia_phi.AAC.1